jgi:hypothetical protein
MTDIEICGLAMGMLGTAAPTSFDDDSDEARACKAAYAPARDAVLGDPKTTWTFALQQLVLNAPDVTAPLFDYPYRYLLPGDVLRAHRADDGSGAYRAQWEVQGRYILMDSPQVYLTAVMKVEDTSLFPASFCLAVATRLAAELAVALTENRQLQTDLWNLYAQKVKDAAAADGRQGTTVRTRSDYLSTRR